MRRLGRALRLVVSLLVKGLVFCTYLVPCLDEVSVLIC
jgi:hypothetical protein